MGTNENSDQTEVIDFLSRPASHQPAPDTVERIDTHGAIVFLAGDTAYKIKRAVRLAYLDFSTLEKRRAACARELEINRLTAPQLYRRNVAIVRRADGTLAFGSAEEGEGEVLEWAVEMARFDQDALLDRMASENRLRAPLMTPLTDHIAAYHAAAPEHRDGDGVSGLARVVDSVTQAFAEAAPWLGEAPVEACSQALRATLDRSRPLLATRARTGYVRRCHGDLHLRNIVLLDGAPTLFDAIEFREDVATIDVLYDLAFLLMDLWHRRAKRHASLVLNRYLWRADARDNIEGLALLPLFLATRAGVRAMVALDAMPVLSPKARNDTVADLKDYFDLAQAFLSPPPARLIAIGGLSGTGKSTLGAGLAPFVGAAPGAVHLRSDVERKLLFGVAPEAPLGQPAYDMAVTRRIYDILNEKAALALAAGQSVILDAVFAGAEERAAAERVAEDAGVPFDGLWLTAPRRTLLDRVARRQGDASDAGVEIVEKQLGYETGKIAWQILSARATPGDVRAAAADLLGLAEY